jgi:excisionase family DNA binding protein
MLATGVPNLGICRARSGGMASSYLTVTEAAAYLNVSKDVIYEGSKMGGLKHVRLLGRRDLRYKTEWLDQWFELSAQQFEAAS